MDRKKVSNQLIIARNLTLPELAKNLNYEPQAFRNKLNRGTYSLNDFIEILNALECDLIVQTRDTKKTFS